MSDYDKVTAVLAVSSKPILENEEDMDAYRQAIERLEKLCHAVVVSQGGTVVRLPSAFGAGDSFEITIPSDNVRCIREIVDRSVEECKVETVAGLGHDIHEAKIAADNALDSDSDILVYHPDMDIVKYEEEEIDLKKHDPMSDAKKILADIKKDSELYEQIRLKNPEAYRAVVDTLNSLVQAVAAQKEDEANDVKEAKAGQSTMDQQDKKNDAEHVKQAKDAMKDVAGSVPIREQSEQQSEPESTDPETIQSARISPEILQNLMQQTVQRYHEQRSGTMNYDKSIEDQDYSYSDDPEFSKSMRYVLMHGSLYGQ